MTKHGLSFALMLVFLLALSALGAQSGDDMLILAFVPTGF